MFDLVETVRDTGRRGREMVREMITEGSKVRELKEGGLYSRSGDYRGEKRGCKKPVIGKLELCKEKSLP